MQLGPQSCFATRVGIGRKHRTHKVSSPFKSSQVDLSDLGVFGMRVHIPEDLPAAHQDAHKAGDSFHRLRL